ncbi:MAG: efflux RND transporter periplasmic adaptor subunit [gamma proteobacterium symbiont of Bathyaustriella thionipta]|nr:efflux RND transporter periplasmic adaptor subunit [gamma proteobacterium symbiont of Bathyaustriella thionipta]
MNKKPLRIVLLLLLIAAAAAGWWYTKQHDEVDASRLLLYGNIDVREVDLTFNNSEHIDQIVVQEGDRVKKGQLVATLHTARLQAQLSAAQAKVSAQQAVVARFLAGSRPQEIRKSRAAVAAIQARLDDAKITYQRTLKLQKDKAVSLQDLDDARAGLNTAKADLNAAKEALALMLEGPREEDIAEAQAMLKVDEAQQALAKEVLDDARLYAPADGIIRNRILEPGDMASPQKPVLTLALTNPLWVRAYAPETILGKLHPGMRAEVSTDSYPGKAYQGWIGFISPTAEFTPRNVETPDLRTRLVYQVRVYVCNPQDELRLGMPASVSIDLQQSRSSAEQPISDCPQPTP